MSATTKLPHAAEQCIKHYGVNIHLNKFRNRILAAQGRFVKSHPNCPDYTGQARFASHSVDPDRNFYFVEFDGKTFKVLFSESSQKCITVVPLEFRQKVNDRKHAKDKRRFFRDLEVNDGDSAAA